MFDSVRPQRWQPTRLPRPRDSPGKNTGVGCHFLLQCMKVKSESEVTQLCPTQWPHRLQPTRLLHPWGSPGKSTGVGCHCLLRELTELITIAGTLSNEGSITEMKSDLWRTRNLVYKSLTNDRNRRTIQCIYFVLHLSYFYLFIFFKFYFIFKLYIIVLVLPNIKLNPPLAITAVSFSLNPAFTICS